MAVRFVVRSLVLMSVAAWALACGSSASRAAPVRCDRFAAPGGSDRAPGTARRPLRTVQRLADHLRPGQTGCLRSGTYADEVSGPYVLRANHGGAPGRPITVRSAPGQRAHLRGIVYFPPAAGHFVLSHVDLDGRRPAGADRPVSVQVLARNVTLGHDTITNERTKSCVILGVADGAVARRTIIRDTTFRDCGDPADGMLDHAVYVARSRDARITRSAFVRSAGWAVQLYPDAQRTRVKGNVMWDNG